MEKYTSGSYSADHIDPHNDPDETENNAAEFLAQTKNIGGSGVPSSKPEKSPGWNGIKKILFVFPPYVDVSLRPGNDGYKGTERSGVYIINEMAARKDDQGRKLFDIHVVASEGSEIAGTLHPSCKKHWDNTDPANPRSASPDAIAKGMDDTVRLMKSVIKQENPNIIDCHIAHNTQVNELLEQSTVPHLVTFHGPTKDRPDLQAVAEKHPYLPVATVSKQQQKFLQANYCGVVPNGLPPDVVCPSPDVKKTHLAMLGRLSPKKDFVRGIEIAKLAGKKLVIACTLLDDQKDLQYYHEVLKPLFDKERDTVEIRWDINEQNKSEFFSDKIALLALTKRISDKYGPEYIEADGMHITEATAADVITLRDIGVDPSKPGILCISNDEFLVGIRAAENFSPGASRRHFEKNYTIDRIVDRRLQLFLDVIAKFDVK